MASNTQSSISTNPHFNNASSAPSELGHLLRYLPADFNSQSQVTPDILLRAEAVVQHAKNENYTLIRGLQVLGQMLFVAGNSDDYPLKPSDLEGLGCLITHIAVEAEFAQEIHEEFEYIVNEHRARISTDLKKNGGKS